MADSGQSDVLVVGGGLAGTPLQARMKIPDTPEVALRAWLRFGKPPAHDTHSHAWARHYVEQSRQQVYDWLTGEGIKFMPAVNCGGAPHERRRQQPSGLPHRAVLQPDSQTLDAGRCQSDTV